MCARGIEAELLRVNRDAISAMRGTQHHVNKLVSTWHHRTDCNDALTRRHPGSTLSLWILYTIVLIVCTAHTSIPGPSLPLVLSTNPKNSFFGLSILVAAPRLFLWLLGGRLEGV